MIGKMGEFDIKKDTWTLYIERLEQYFVVNEIKDEAKVPTLITLMGAESYELLVNLCTPMKPKDKKFEDIVMTMTKHLQPKPSELAERYKFRHRLQKSGESIGDYVAALKKMTKTCDFGSWLEESLRDQLVCGIHSETIRQRLFAESNLDFAKAYSLAASMETAEKDAAVVVEGNGRSSTAENTNTADCQAMAVGAAWRRKQGNGARNVSGTVRETGSRGGGTGGGRGARRQTQAAATAEPRCSACGGSHDHAACRFKRYVCRVCNRMGHLRRMCPNLTQQHFVAAATDETEDEQGSDMSEEVIIIDINKLAISQCKPIIIPISILNKKILMECDTGSAISCISYDLYEREFKSVPLQGCNIVLGYYTGEMVRPVGVLSLSVMYKSIKKILDLYVIRNGKSALLGRQWIAELNVQLPNIDYNFVNNIDVDKNFDVSTFSSRYCKVFADGLGRFTGPAVSIHVREGARPVFLRARPLAYALREPVERALEQHVRDGILTPVERSEWATPIVPIVKKDGNIRICADFKVTLNKVLEIDRYPLPRVEDLLVRLHGGQHYSKIDLSQAYAQFVLDDSKKYTVINTHKGLFMYNRLVYGLASSPGIFQRRLEEMFADLPHVGVFLDDVIITGKTKKEHIDNLYEVFSRLEKYGLRVKKEKCEFFEKSINYLGHVISEDGVHTCPNKVKAILDVKAPSNVSELRSFIGMVMYYSKFVKNISTLLAPLYKLLRSGVTFAWSKECQLVFDKVKGRLASAEVLTHYSTELPVVVTADASSVGVGAVLAHITPAGERPVAYASRSLTETERHYSQLDKEALAIVFAIRKYHQYLFGRKFLLRTDHKPLTHILGDKVGIPVMAASRLQRWAVLLSGYNYTIEYVPSNKNCADALSRLTATNISKSRAAKEVTYTNFVENFLPITNSDVRKLTEKDPVLSRIKFYVESGWPGTCTDEEIKPFFVRKNELYTEGGCIMWGYRMIIPKGARDLVLKQLHVSHLGIVKTKSWARSYVWWPGVDRDVEELCRACETCAQEADAPPHAPPRPWPYHSQPWARLHIDFLGPIQNKTFMVIIDSASKWLEIFEMKSTNAHTVIKVLRSLFARFGLPTEVVSDQGPPFSSNEFKSFLKYNGIRQGYSPVYHPSSNGAAENAVKQCKRAIKKAFRDNVDLEKALQTFLLVHRNTVHSSTGETPAMLLQKRRLRTRIDLIRNEVGLENRVQSAQNKQAQNAGGIERSFAIGDTVWSRRYNSNERWVKGKIVDKEGSRQYIVDNGNGQFQTRHVDQVRRRSRWSMIPDVTSPNSAVHDGGCESSAVGGGGSVDPQGGGMVDEVVRNNMSLQGEPSCSPSSPNRAATTTSVTEPNSPHVPLQPQPRPKRLRKPVLRYGFESD